MLPLLLLVATCIPCAREVVVAPGESLHVEVRGSGPDVVLIPGLFGSAYGYRAVVEHLVAAGRRTIVIEPLGLGNSSRPRGADYSLTAQAARIAAVLDSLGVDSAVVVSHAVGTGIALRLALARPLMVRSVISLGGGIPESAATAGLRRAVSWAPLLRILGAGSLRKRVHGSLVHSSGDTSWVTDSVIAHYTGPATADLGATLAAFRGMVQSTEAVQLLPRLGEIRCPVILLLGAAPHEGRTADGEVELLRSGVRRFELQLVPGAGSYLQEERPDAVFAVISRMVTGGARVVDVVAAARP
ncbi:MAG: alpha/beta hydrolase [Gemmatimonadota bacterium]